VAWRAELAIILFELEDGSVHAAYRDLRNLEPLELPNQPLRYLSDKTRTQSLSDLLESGRLTASISIQSRKSEMRDSGDGFELSVDLLDGLGALVTDVDELLVQTELGKIDSVVRVTGAKEEGRYRVSGSIPVEPERESFRVTVIEETTGTESAFQFTVSTAAVRVRRAEEQLERERQATRAEGQAREKARQQAAEQAERDQRLREAREDRARARRAEEEALRWQDEAERRRTKARRSLEVSNNPVLQFSTSLVGGSGSQHFGNIRGRPEVGFGATVYGRVTGGILALGLLRLSSDVYGVQKVYGAGGMGVRIPPAKGKGGVTTNLGLAMGASGPTQAGQPPEEWGASFLISGDLRPPLSPLAFHFGWESGLVFDFGRDNALELFNIFEVGVSFFIDAPGDT